MCLQQTQITQPADECEARGNHVGTPRFFALLHGKKHSPSPFGCWLAGWLVGWLVGWLAGWLVGWLVGLAGLAGWLVGWLAGWLVGWLVGWVWNTGFDVYSPL